MEAATTTNSDGTQSVDDKYLTSILVGLNKSIAALQENATDTVAKQYIEAQKRRVEFDASVRRLEANLHNTAGRERGEIIRSAQQDLANIRDNYTKLVSENPAMIGSVTTKTEQSVVSAGDTPQARADGWDMLLGDLNDLGVVSSGNPEVIAIWRWAQKRLGDPEDPSFSGDEELRRRAIEFKRIAADAENQKSIAGKRLDDQLGALTSSITGLAGQADLQKAIGESVNQLQKLGASMAELKPMPANNQAAEAQMLLNGTKQYNEMMALQDRVTKELFGGAVGSDSIHDQLARMVGSKHFQEWAASNGYRIGKVEYNEDGSINTASYIPSKQDIQIGRAHV